MGAAVATLIGKRGGVRIPEAELFGVGQTAQQVGVLVESEARSFLEGGVLLAELVHDLFVLWSEGGFVHLGLPEEVALVGFLELRHVFEALDIHRGFRFDAEDPGCLLPGGLAFEHLVDRAASEFQILLDLIAGDELRGAHGIEGAGAAVAGE